MPKLTRETSLTSKTKDGELLSEKEELFCQKYVYYMGKGTKAAMESYGDEDNPINYNTAGAMASENLRKPKILARIRELLDAGPLSEQRVDAELSFLVAQDDDLSAKRGGIEIYNKLKARYEEHNKQQAAVINICKYDENSGN